MIKNPRQQKIINLLNKNEIVIIKDLSRKLNSSSMTIRRDLEYFEDKGIVRRIHGGAVLLKNEGTLPSFSERIDICEKEKVLIGRAAVSFIKPESIVCFDSGTTSLAIAQNISENIHFTAITTGILTASTLCRFPRLEIIQVGGSLHHSSYTSCGFLSKNFIKQFNADVVFLSTRAVKLGYGTYESSMDLVEEKKALMSISKKVVLVADHTKFEEHSLCQAISFENIDVIVTDDKTPIDIVKKLKCKNIEVIIVKT